MKTYKLITNSPYDIHAPVSYWIEEKEKYFFNLLSRRKILGQYIFDNGGADSQMPFFTESEALERIKLLQKQN